MRPFALSLALVGASAAIAAGAPSGPAPAPSATPQGHLILMGGADTAVAGAKKFVELAGGPDAPLVVFPTASEEPEKSGREYSEMLRDQGGSRNVAVVDVRKREDALRPDYVAMVERAKGIFFGGGDQVRIMDALLGTPVGDAIVRAHERGIVVGGSSAGTACQSEVMITGEGDFTVVRAGAVETKRGWGFFRGVVVDQHFIIRQRLDRLFSVILEHPDLVGVGVDEDTTIWVRPDNTFEVLGPASVMVIDPASAAVARMKPAAGKELLGARDLRVHFLLPGQVYDVGARKIVK